MAKFNEYSTLAQVAIRSAANAFVSESKLAAEWQPLRFHAQPNLSEAIDEYRTFRALLSNSGTEIIDLPAGAELTIDAIYTRDSILVSPKGLILCNMGRASRTPEAKANAEAYRELGHNIAGQIQAPGTLEGGDFIWLDDQHAAVGLGPRTNSEGIRQLQEILGPEVELHVVELPQPDHPDDVLHLMSIISPIDCDLALIYRPFMPDSFISWLEGLGVGFVDVPEEEYLPMGCNVLAIAPRNALMLENLPGVKAGLEAAGCRVNTYKGLEISRKGEGGPTCLTRPLRRI
ncbi:MAG: amidinotransferase [Porticoccaceae bacterium]|jgi:N-dimethylarginine dimethylaminohydrolase|nr:amidinotransferase [Porticoccaceae bacterium]MBT5577758.1 amidinotransferase [Porticoccaceae bacterium]MBT7376390.1 amidinotransferase [Porticoccaceae bacterium]